jgi:hypothetical protein
MKKSVLQYGEKDEDLPLVLKYNLIRPSVKEGTIHTTRTTKSYRCQITKGVVLENMRVVPFGWRPTTDISNKIV